MYRIKRIRPSLQIFLLLVTISACGGGGGDGSSPATPATPQTGVFIDGPIANIGYKTETITGVTDPDGSYTYLPGEHVTFFIGNLEFPPVAATGVVTPLDIAGTTDTADPTVVNMIRLLQTLDSDPTTDAIEITDAAKTTAMPVDFSLSVADFASSTAVTDLTSSLSTTLVSEADAITRFQSGLDAVSIDLTKYTASSVITFDKCLYTPGGWNYTFTDTTITFTGSDTWDTNAGCTLGPQETFPVAKADWTSGSDLPFNCANYPICTSTDFNKILSGTDVDGRAFTSTYSYDSAKKQITYIKTASDVTSTDMVTEVISLHAVNDPTSIIGAWLAESSSTDYDLVVFIDQHRYIVIHTNNAEFDAALNMTIPQAAEYGTYTWDAATGAMTVTELGQSDGQGGLYDPNCTSGTYSVDGDQLNLQGCGGSSYSFTKVASADSPIGAWAGGASDTDYSALVFLDDTRYVIAHTNNTEPDAALGITVPVSAEFGTYTWDPVSEAFTATVLGESDGQGGLVDNMASSNYTVQLNTDTIIVSDSTGSGFTASRVR